MKPSVPPVAVSLYVTLYSLALADVRICANDGLPDDAVAAATVPEAAVVAVTPLVVVPEGVVPPHDAAITNANTRAAALPLFTTQRR